MILAGANLAKSILRVKEILENPAGWLRKSELPVLQTVEKRKFS
jgi:hypothetical protein